MLKRIVVVVALWACMQVSASAADSLVFCVEDKDVRPWRTKDGKGLNFELLDQAVQSVGARVIYRSMPWKRCLAELKENLVQGAMGASFKPDRLEFGVYPGGDKPDARKRLNYDRYILVRKAGSGVEWDGRVLRGLVGPVGAQLGYSVVDDLRKLNVPVDDGAPSARDAVRKLQAGFVGAVAVLEGEARTIMNTDSQLFRGLEILPVPVVEKPYFLMFSHAFVAANEKQASDIWSAIAKVRESREYRALEKREIMAGQK